jgi:uncharacterized OsmC-like protein
MHVELDQVAGRRFAIRARGLEVIVDDTIEAGGPGDGFRPTELLLGALAACMAGTMTNFATDQDIPIRGISMELEDEVSKAPARIGRVHVTMTVDAEASDRQSASLERVASACKIHNTLQESPDIELSFEVA